MKDRLTVEVSLKEYENIINHLVWGLGEDECGIFYVGKRSILINKGCITYDKTLEDLGNKDGTKYTSFVLKQKMAFEKEVIWDVAESHGHLNYRMSGFGSYDEYKENKDGTIDTIRCGNIWIS